jgi:hypothetical protein
MNKQIKATVLIFVAVACAGPSFAQEEFFQQEADYLIRVHLDTENKMSTGEEMIHYVNNSPDTLTEFYLHLYPNAFRGKESEYFQHRSRIFNHAFGNIPKANRGWMELHDVTVDGDAVTVEVDDTIARMALPKPLLPGESMDVRLRFESKLRKRYGRAGYIGDHYDFAQWYPKVVVYDERGFRPDKHKAGEFYGEFGKFDVSIELPSHYVVAATGTLAEGDPGWNYNTPGGSTPPGRGSTKTVRFVAEKVHDFAWCANPTFVVQDTTWNGVVARVFYRKRNEGAWKDVTLTHTVRALEWLDKVVGRYGYPQVTIVDVPSAYGMEYPMLAMNGRASEGLVVHEVGHIYFQGMLANDERAEAWLDEGFTAFQTRWYMKERYGPYGDTDGWNWYQRMTPQYGLWEQYRHNVMGLQRRGYGERTAKRAEDYNNSYRIHVYQKSALFLNAIRYVTGDEEFEKILHEYYTRWQFKHVNEERFRKVCEDWSHTDLTRAFEQWLHTTKTCDYKLDEVKSVPAAGGGVEVLVRIKREGELFIPIDLVFELETGDTLMYRIDSRLRAIEETYHLPSKPKRTAINPYNEILDVNLRDNFQPRQRDFQVDWPNNDYAPEWGYQFRHRPGAWYNDVDGLKAGYMARGSYLNSPPRWRLGVYYGFLSERVDFDVRYEHPLEILGNRSVLHLSGYKMEGRQDATAYIKVRRRSKLTKPPTQEVLIGFNYHVLTDPEYLPAPDIYDTNEVDLGPYFEYSIYPEFDWFSTRLDADLKLGRDWWGGDFKYERFTTTGRLNSRPNYFPIDLRLRYFLGAMGGVIPLQEQFQIASAGVLQQEKHFWLRSPGAVWDWLNYHEGGDGNIRGYYEGTFGVNTLFSTNVEMGTRLPLFALERITRPLVGPISWYGFYDVGWILDSENPNPSNTRLTDLVDRGVLGWTLQDAGIGLQSRKMHPFWDLTLRFDMPIWVNHPSINGEEETTKFRYLFSLTTTF